MNNKLEIMWKEVIVTKFCGENKENHEKHNQDTVPAEIRTEHLPNTTSKRYRLSQLTRPFIWKDRIVEEACQVSPADIRTRGLLNTSIQRCHHTYLLHPLM